MLARIEFFAQVRLRGASNEIRWLDYHPLQLFAKLEQKKNIQREIEAMRGQFGKCAKLCKYPPAKLSKRIGC